MIEPSHNGTALRVAEQRRHQRVRTELLGRYMLSDRREYPCQTVDMSPGGPRPRDLRRPRRRAVGSVWCSIWSRSGGWKA